MNDEIKELIIKSLNIPDIKPSDIDDKAPLFNDGLGLDSVDALELGLAIQKTYGIVLDAKTTNLKEVFYSVDSLAKYIEQKKG
ncbi:MAG: acyl carrier protein [Campylobacter sp.]|nr:acyl carrier protein [Campylobacter sp.]